MPLDVSAIELTEALNALPSIGSIRVFFDDAASQPLDNKFAWQIEFLQDGEPAHVGDETLLSGSVAEGVTVQVEKLRSGIATEDKIRLRAVDQAGEWVKSEALVVVRPVHDWPKISLAALEANFYATGMEDEAIFNLFRGISIFVDHDGRQNEMALATLEVNCAHKCTLLVTNSEFPHTWIDDSRGESSGDTSLKLQGTVHVLQELIRGCTLIPEPNFFGVEIVNLWLTDSRGFITKRTLAASVTPVNDPPSITVSNQSLPLIVSSSKAAKFSVAPFSFFASSFSVVRQL